MQATLAGRPFRVNPESASWNYTVKTSEENTVGGIVVQVLGVDLGDMTVQGAFGIGGWQEQAAFLDHVKKLSKEQIHHPEAGPVRFLFPAKGWDYQVIVRGYTEVGAGDAVVASNDNFNPTWQLQLFIVEDNSPIKTVQNTAMLQYINRLLAGLGWKPGSKYNGPVSEADVQAFLSGQGASSVSQLLQGLAP